MMRTVLRVYNDFYDKLIRLIILFLSLALSVSVEFAEQAPNHSENKIIRLELKVNHL